MQMIAPGTGIDKEEKKVANLFLYFHMNNEPESISVPLRIHFLSVVIISYTFRSSTSFVVFQLKIT